MLQTEISSKYNPPLFLFVCLFSLFIFFYHSPGRVGNYCVIMAGKTRHVIRKLNFARESRNCVVVRSRGADSV